MFFLGFVEWNWRAVGKMGNGVENGILEEVLGPIWDHFLYGPNNKGKLLRLSNLLRLFP